MISSSSLLPLKRDLTVVAANKRVAVLVLELAVHVLLSLLKSDVHVAVKARENS